MSTFAPSDLLPQMSWDMFPSILGEIKDADITCLIDTLFDTKSTSLSTHQETALRSIRLGEMTFTDKPGTSVFVVSNDRHSIEFSNRVSTRGELRGSKLKSLLLRLGQQRPEWTLEQALKYTATSLDENSLFAYFVSSWTSTPGTSLDQRFTPMLIAYAHNCYNKICMGKTLTSQQIQSGFNHYYPLYVGIKSKHDVLKTHAALCKNIVSNHLGTLLHYLRDHAPITRILNQWQHGIDDLFDGKISLNELKKNHTILKTQILAYLNEHGLGMNQAVEQLANFDEVLVLPEWVNLWGNCINSFLNGEIFASEFKSDSRFFYSDLCSRFPAYKGAAVELMKELYKIPHVKLDQSATSQAGFFNNENNDNRSSSSSAHHNSLKF